MYIVIMTAANLHELVWMSRPLMQAAEACVERGLDGTPLTVRMRAVLEILETYGSQTVPDVAAKLDIKRQYVQLMVNETLAAGFIEQRSNPRHKRSPLLGLTDEGRELIKHIISKEMEVMEHLDIGFDEDAIASALQVVLAVTKRLKAISGEEA